MFVNPRVGFLSVEFLSVEFLRVGREVMMIGFSLPASTSSHIIVRSSGGRLRSILVVGEMNLST